MKRVFLGLLLFVMLFIVSACTGKDADRETEQLTELTSCMAVRLPLSSSF